MNNKNGKIIFQLVFFDYLKYNKDRDKIIEEKENFLKDKDKIIEEKENDLKEKENVLKDKDKIIEEKRKCSKR